MTQKAPNSVVEIIDTWPVGARKLSRLHAFARDLGIKYTTAAVIRHRDSIAPEHWARLIAKRVEGGMTDVTVEVLLRIASRRATSRAKRARRPSSRAASAA